MLEDSDMTALKNLEIEKQHEDLLRKLEERRKRRSLNQMDEDRDKEAIMALLEQARRLVDT